MILSVLCIKYVNTALSKFGATKCAPARAFHLPKTHLPRSINRESLFLRLGKIEPLFFKLGATGCAPAWTFYSQK